MGGGQQRAHGRLVAGPEQAGGVEDAAVLGDDVPGQALQGRVGQPGQLPDVGDVAQRPHAQRGRGLGAGAAAFGVAAVAERVPGPGVDDQQRQAGRGRVERDRGARSVAAVEQQRLAGPALQRRDLVHDPARYPDEIVLRGHG